MNYNKNNKMSKISSVSELAKEDLKEINGGMPLIAIAAYGTA